MADTSTKPGLFDEITEKLGGSAEKGVKSALLEYLNSPKGEAKVTEAVSSFKTFLLVVGSAVTYYYVKKSG
jgi:hypothetical protein